jgi:MtrB/PioB family decaheme-associated outer membrane protein
MSAREGESMKSKGFIIISIAGALCLGAGPGASSGAEEKKISGEVSFTAQHLNMEGEKGKFNEYRDIQDGFYGDVNVQYEDGNYYLDFRGSEIGRKTQSYEFLGGKWGSFRYNFSYDQLPHNFTENARTFYSGVGGGNLTYPTQPPNSNFTTWNKFDYSLERRNYAGGLKFDLFKPFYFDVSVAREARKGVYPLGFAGTTPGGIALEIPSPIDYTTDSLKMEAGYNKNPLALSLSYYYSAFQNDHSSVYFRNPATDNTASTTDNYTLPPDNDYYKFNFKGAMKLPWNSKFNANLAFSRAQSDANLFDSYAADVTAAASNIGVQGRTGVILNDYIFNGKVATQSYHFTLTSNPLYFLDGKVFYRYYDHDNRSDPITTTDSTATPATFTTHPFSYRKQKAGAELGFRLPASFYLSGGYSYVETKRNREDISKNHDDIINAELRWSGADFMLAKVGYERLRRKAEFEAPQGLSPADSENIETYLRRYDAAAKDRNTYKAVLEFFPVEDLNFSFGYKRKNTDYKDTILGLQDDKRDEFTVDADYLILKRVRLFGYFDYEYIKLHQFQRQIPSPTTAYDPALAPTATAFNWTSTQTERNYGYGLGMDLYLIPKKLTLRLQNNYLKSDGYADYSYLLGTNLLPAGRSEDNIDISNWDDYRLQNYLVKVIYHMTPSISFTGGWAYEKYVYNDAQYNGYQYVPATTGSSGAYLTGAYQDPGYRAHVFFLSTGYKF